VLVVAWPEPGYSTDRPIPLRDFIKIDQNTPVLKRLNFYTRCAALVQFLEFRARLERTTFPDKTKKMGATYLEKAVKLFMEMTGDKRNLASKIVANQIDSSENLYSSEYTTELLNWTIKAFKNWPPSEKDLEKAFSGQGVSPRTKTAPIAAIDLIYCGQESATLPN